MVAGLEALTKSEHRWTSRSSWRVFSAPLNQRRHLPRAEAVVVMEEEEVVQLTTAIVAREGATTSMSTPPETETEVGGDLTEMVEGEMTGVLMAAADIIAVEATATQAVEGRKI